MRQAGRFDPEYRALREKVELPLEDLFRTPDLAAQISLLPRRFGVDAIIIYQDILTPLAPMGAKFVFRPGPILESPIRRAEDIAALPRIDPASSLGFVADTLRMVRTEVAGELPVLGFAGAPLTLACFLIEGRSPGTNCHITHEVMAKRPKDMHRLLEKLADMTVEYLLYQFHSGADAVQLFESVGHLLSHEEYLEFAHPYHQRILSSIGGFGPRILYVREQYCLELMAQSGAEVLSIGSAITVAEAKQRVGNVVAIQGNINNQLIADSSLEDVAEATRQCVIQGGHNGHILNLSHGVLPRTPFENGCRVVDTCRSTICNESSLNEQ